MGRPERASASSTAEGPGAQVTGRPRSMARRTMAKPGSLMVGMPGIGHDEHGGAGFDLVEQAVGLVALVVVVIGDDATVHIDRERRARS